MQCSSPHLLRIRNPFLLDLQFMALVLKVFLRRPCCHLGFCSCRFHFWEKAAPCHPQKHPFAGMPNPCNGDAAFHWGVECDGCGVTPIKGPRYKSTKTFNFDLCSTCFKAIGDEAHYQKLDLPAHHPPFHGHYRPPCFRRGPRPFMGPPVCRPSFARGPYGWKTNCGYSGQQLNSCQAGEEHKELDARFVKDVTIFDGTELAPCTKFTKIWHMSNIGTLPWPQSTQLVHIGGDALCTKEAVNLELSEGGLPRGEDVDKVKAIQESLLQSLESMGFTNWGLNTLLLHKNNQNLQQTVDDLLAAAGWDGALQDLEEMGFTDKSTNFRLLVKNEGNIKWAVKDLVKLEKHAVEG